MLTESNFVNMLSKVEAKRRRISQYVWDITNLWKLRTSGWPHVQYDLSGQLLQFTISGYRCFGNFLSLLSVSTTTTLLAMIFLSFIAIVAVSFIFLFYLYRPTLLNKKKYSAAKSVRFYRWERWVHSCEGYHSTWLVWFVLTLFNGAAS